MCPILTLVIPSTKHDGLLMGVFLSILMPIYAVQLLLTTSLQHDIGVVKLSGRVDLDNTTRVVALSWNSEISRLAQILPRPGIFQIPCYSPLGGIHPTQP